MNVNNNALESELIQQQIESGGKRKMAFLFQKRMKLWGNEKGLTLIELLAVIVILAIISAIAIPAIGGIISKSKVHAQYANGLMIISAARYADIDQNPAMPKTYYLTELKSGGYLSTIPTDPADNVHTYNADLSKVDISVTAAGVKIYKVTLSGTGATATTFVDRGVTDLDETALQALQ
jgi:type IV pilus assembly protein PilA